MGGDDRERVISTDHEMRIEDVQTNEPNAEMVVT